MLLTRRQMLALAGGMLAPVVSSAAESIIRLTTAGGRQSSVSFWRSRDRSRGTILFSHGAASSPNKYPDLVDAWTRADYDVWAPLHVDSIAHPETSRFAGFASWTARIEDMRALAKHVRAKKVIAAGHSYGALVALTIGGVNAAQPAGVVGPLRIAKVQAVIAFSPPAPVPDLITAEGYKTLAGPAQTAQLHTAAEISTVFLDAYGANQSRARKALTARLSDTGTVILRTK